MDMANFIFQKPVDGALYLFDKGVKVFPLVADGKIPAFKGWQEWAKTANRKKIEEFSIANPLNNWGVSTEPSKLIVIDIDIKAGRNGLEAFKDFLAKCPNLRSNKPFSVLTPSGGYHYYYHGLCQSGIDVLGVGVDIKSIGGYVVAPGSRIGEKVYEIF